MKELSIEEKAKAYDEAVKVIKDNLDALNEITETGSNVVNIQSIRNCFYRAFPELKEAEDEKIRKWIIGVLSTYEHDRDLRNAAIAWLEKQGEKPFDYENANIQQNDFTPKIEQSIEIPFGAKDSELQEASYYIPKGFYSVLDGNKVIIKRFKNPRPQNN